MRWESLDSDSTHILCLSRYQADIRSEQMDHMVCDSARSMKFHDAKQSQQYEQHAAACLRRNPIVQICLVILVVLGSYKPPILTLILLNCCHVLLTIFKEHPTSSNWSFFTAGRRPHSSGVCQPLRKFDLRVLGHCNILDVETRNKSEMEQTTQHQDSRHNSQMQRHVI